MSKLTVTLPDDLHQQIRLELERQGITTAQFIELAVHNFFEQQKEGTHMATRTMAFQVSEELFQRIKEYLSRFEQVYHRKLTQKEFIVSLIEGALADADEEFEAALAAQQSEIEMTGLTRQQAARTLAELFGTSITHYGGTYDGYRVADREGKDWKIVSDGSINAFRRSNGRQVPAGREYRVEMNSPKLEYAEMEKLQEVVRALRHAGAFVNDSCGMHVHIDAARHTPKSLKNLLSIMYSKEDILFAALKVDESRTRRWCRRVEEPVLQTIRKLPNGASMEMLKSRWYQGHDGSNDHYDLSRYHAVNLHSVFYHGTVEFRLFNATLHAGEVKANIVLAMAISAQAINQQKTLAHKTPIGDNPAFTFRTFLLRLGLIGPEYKNVREHLLKNLPGDRAWRYDKAQYPCNQRHRDDGAR